MGILYEMGKAVQGDLSGPAKIVKNGLAVKIRDFSQIIQLRP